MCVSEYKQCSLNVDILWCKVKKNALVSQVGTTRNALMIKLF